MRDSKNIRELEKLQPDYMGFIFYGKSKRDATELLEQKLAIDVLASIVKTGVFVNEEFNAIEDKITRYSLDAVQLHGDETPELCKQLKGLGVEVIKVFGVGEDFDFTTLEPYKDVVDYFLFDTKGKERGGNGETFDWSLLKQYDGQVPYFLSGGLDLSNVESIKSLADTNLYAIDINSRFEIEPGLKDIEKLKALDFDKTRKLI